MNKRYKGKDYLSIFIFLLYLISINLIFYSVNLFELLFYYYFKLGCIIDKYLNKETKFILFCFLFFWQVKFLYKLAFNVKEGNPIFRCPRTDPISLLFYFFSMIITALSFILPAILFKYNNFDNLIFVPIIVIFLCFFISLIKINENEEKDNDSIFSSDKPREDIQNDIINQLTIVLEQIKDSSDYFSIAIDGKWGAGKTSILKSWQNQLKDNQYSIYWLNVWELQNNDNIIAELIRIFKKEIEKCIYSSSPELFALVNASSKLPMGNISCFLYYFTTLFQKPIEENKKEINRLLNISLKKRKIKKLILIFDDFDRSIDKTEIINALRAIRYCSDGLSNVVTITALDLERTINLINDNPNKNITIIKNINNESNENNNKSDNQTDFNFSSHNHDWSDYLYKMFGIIINVQYMLDQKDIIKYLKDTFNNKLSEFINKYNIHKEYFEELIKIIEIQEDIYDIFKNYREIKLSINDFFIKILQLKDHIKNGFLDKITIKQIFFIAVMKNTNYLLFNIIKEIIDTRYKYLEDISDGNNKIRKDISTIIEFNYLINKFNFIDNKLLNILGFNSKYTNFELKSIQNDTRKFSEYIYDNINFKYIELELYFYPILRNIEISQKEIDMINCCLNSNNFKDINEFLNSKINKDNLYREVEIYYFFKNLFDKVNINKFDINKKIQFLKNIILKISDKIFASHNFKELINMINYNYINNEFLHNDNGEYFKIYFEFLNINPERIKVSLNFSSQIISSIDYIYINNNSDKVKIDNIFNSIKKIINYNNNNPNIFIPSLVFCLNLLQRSNRGYIELFKIILKILAEFNFNIITNNKDIIDKYQEEEFFMWNYLINNFLLAIKEVKIESNALKSSIFIICEILSLFCWNKDENKLFISNDNLSLIKKIIDEETKNEINEKYPLIYEIIK